MNDPVNMGAQSPQPSQPPANAVARRFRRWPLRRQVVLILVVVLAAMTVGVGAVSITVQRQSLVDRLDEQLSVSLDLATHAGSAPLGGQGPQPQGQSEGGLRGPPPGSLEVLVSANAVVRAELVDEAGTTHLLTATNLEKLRASAAEGNGPTEVNLEGFGRYRILAIHASDESGSAVMLVGKSMAEIDRTTNNLIMIYSLVGLLGVAAAALIASYLVGIGLRPLDRLAATAKRVGASALATGAVSLPERIDHDDTGPDTEIGLLGSAFNQMLDNVEHSLRVRHESEERLRRFVADASHELRTPLASVMGYSELALRTPDDLPNDVERSITRISSEAARMSSMVHDLLLLARLDAGDELRQHRVELARVVMDACSDAQVTGPDHEWHLELGEDTADLAVVGDPDRLHQMLMNLLSNARAHTPPHTRVTVRLTSVAGSYAVIQVEDTGPGMDQALQERVFDRFVRGDASRSSVAGSTGLGMSIVAAIVEAHRGLVDIESRPGRTVVTVSIPLA